MNIELSHALLLIHPPESLVRKIRATFTIENPKWLDNEKQMHSNYKTDHWLQYYEIRGNTATVPRGALGLILSFCKELYIPWTILDDRRALSSFNCAFNGTLKGYQEGAVNEVLRRSFAVLRAPTGSGKTVMALSIIAHRKQPALIIVHTKELLHQWVDRIVTFLGIPRNEIGIIGNGKFRIGERITVAIINYLYPVAADIKQHFGHVIVDECHRTPSRTFTEAVSAFDAKYMLGLSATPYRRDGLTQLIGWYVGSTIEIKQDDLTEEDIVFNVEVVTRKTDFTPW
jgi:superfamily II DNA or RNA helicase